MCRLFQSRKQVLEIVRVHARTERRPVGTPGIHAEVTLREGNRPEPARREPCTMGQPHPVIGGRAVNQDDRRSGALLDPRERRTGDRHAIHRSVSSRNCISECHERRSATSLYTMPPSLLWASGFVNECTVWPYACSCQSAPASESSLAMASTSSGGASGSS